MKRWELSSPYSSREITRYQKICENYCRFRGDGINWMFLCFTIFRPSRLRLRNMAHQSILPLCKKRVLYTLQSSIEMHKAPRLSCSHSMRSSICGGLRNTAVGTETLRVSHQSRVQTWLK